MPAQLVALNDGPTILVDKPILLLGRHPECDIQIESRKISRRHCCIAQVNDYLVIRDLDSTNGIRINGSRVIEGRLNPGDEVTIGNHLYRVTWHDAAPARKAPPAPRPVPAPPPADDVLLESCDEPVALPDPGRNKRAAPPPPKPPAKKEESFVLPDDLDLLPNSGSLPGGGQPK
ncbi:MAG: FHA domain-containing protein [Gemmataceae bacterium]